MKIKVMIAEDERLAREELEFLLSRMNDVELCPSAKTGKELLSFFDQFLPDVVFLDIDMPELEGMSAAKELKNRIQQPLLVFTTAYDEYAVEAFRLKATDYLLKPYSEEQLEEALQRVRDQLQDHSLRAEKQVQPQLTSTYQVRSNFSETIGSMSKLLLDDGERLIVVDPKKILYVCKEERVVQIYTKDQYYTAKLTLQELEDKLRPFHFFRCHRSYLVNLEYIKEIIPWFNGAYNIHLRYIDSLKIPVSRSAAKDLFRVLGM